MKSSNFTFKDEYDVNVFVYKWEPDLAENIKGTILFLHGLASHAKRFQDSAESLTNAGFICYVPDLRGHGKTAGEISKLGIFGPGETEGQSKDIKQLADIIKKENPSVPMFGIGHSYGSVLLQDFMQRYGKELKGAILSGSTGKQDMLQIVKWIAKREIKKVGYDGPSVKLDEIVLASNNKPFKKTAKTKFDWLSRDEGEVKKYIDDPYCGFICTAGYYLALGLNAEQLWRKENEAKIPKDLPIFFIAGTKDSVSKNTKKVKALMKRYKKNGLINISHKFYADARHELNHELKETRQEVFQDVINWINSNLE
ncbi:MAG: alpha/beta fold hydrolase [Promethearchaeota archaeon]